MVFLLGVQTFLLFEENKNRTNTMEETRVMSPATNPKKQYTMIKPMMAPPTAHAAHVM
jgi:hypothetical protein